MPEPRVIRREEVTSVQRAPGVSVASSVTKEVGATEISSGITTFQAGTSNSTHYHNAEESVIVIEGEGILMINGQEHPVRQYDAAFLPRVPHPRLINTRETPFRIPWAAPPVACDPPRGAKGARLNAVRQSHYERKRHHLPLVLSPSKDLNACQTRRLLT